IYIFDSFIILSLSRFEDVRNSCHLRRRRQVEIDIEGKPPTRRSHHHRRERITHVQGRTRLAVRPAVGTQRHGLEPCHSYRLLRSRHRVQEQEGMRGRCGGREGVQEGEAGGRVAELEIQRWGRGGIRQGRGGGFDGAAAGAGGGGSGPSTDEDGGEVARVGVGEVGLGLGAAELESGGVVGARRLLRRVEGTEPDAALLRGVADLRGVPPPRPLPHAPEANDLQVSSSLSGVASLRPRSHCKTPKLLCFSPFRILLLCFCLHGGFS
ncbi:unnamed protein product, partial [Musa hybrid cultivar]